MARVERKLLKPNKGAGPSMTIIPQPEKNNPSAHHPAFKTPAEKMRGNEEA